MLVRIKQGVFEITEELQEAYDAQALEYKKGKFVIDEEKLKEYQEKQKELESQLNNL